MLAIRAAPTKDAVGYETPARMRTTSTTTTGRRHHARLKRPGKYIIGCRCSLQSTGGMLQILALKNLLENDSRLAARAPAWCQTASEWPRRVQRVGPPSGAMSGCDVMPSDSGSDTRSRGARGIGHVGTVPGTQGEASCGHNSSRSV